MSSKRSCFATPASSLLPVLLRCGDFSVAVMRTLVLLLTFKGVAPLVSISKEIYSAKIIIFQAPKEWINNDEVRMMFSAMLGTTESEWKRRIDTSLVETLVLGVNDSNGCHKTDIVIDTWFRSFENKFPNLLSLTLTDCSNITDLSVSEVARRCSKLHTLTLTGCGNITDLSVSEVARRCSKLHTLDLQGCWKISDLSVSKVARRCSKLHTLNLQGCWKITDLSVSEVARRCSKLHTLNLSSYGSYVTDLSVSEVARRCSKLHTLDLEGCWKITDASVSEVARRCSKLHTLNLRWCESITDASVSEVARQCSNLHTLILTGCGNVTSTCKDALQQAHPQLQLKD